MMLKRMEATVCHLTRVPWLTHLARHHPVAQRWQYSAEVLLILLTLVTCYRRQHLCFHPNVLTSQVFIVGFQSLSIVTTTIPGQHLIHTVIALHFTIVLYSEYISNYLSILLVIMVIYTVYIYIGLCSCISTTVYLLIWHRCHFARLVKCRSDFYIICSDLNS